MSDRWVLVLALAAAAGAVLARAAPLPLAVGAAVAALAVRSPAALCVAAGLLASCLSARAWAGLDPPAPVQWSGTAVLAGDPQPAWGGLRMEVRMGGRRAEASARGPNAARLSEALAGERVDLTGVLRPVEGKARAYLARRHIAARLTVQEVGRRRPGPAPMRLANGIRRTIMRGAEVLPGQQRALFAGFVLGDQRAESDATKDAFRASGLGHLLVVSGENVAFALALVRPALRRLRLGPRLLAALAVLALFGLLTRGEPSVLRAEAMAAIAVAVATLGRPASTHRLLCLAVTGLLLVDPLLVGSVGFLLSVAATAGIAWLTPWLHRRLPLAVAVTLAAQAGVTPVLVGVFGSVPLASLPANLLAIPAAGPVMMWGLAAGLPAGILGPEAAALIHLPTRLLIGWVALVARRFADAGLPEARAPVLAGAAAAVVAATAVGRRVASARAPRSRPP
ncbi:MAG TPA: ComEC/Rec2 family competence protein [Acidimicrobiales bacterium]|jgi:competence protein ComEC|nr:ComEC/Rec2 family competence protein [Acidimicrobiales bacterium]